jgi:thiamine pyrophosphate-dependent acetolactate synthase large subunit-like protein
VIRYSTLAQVIIDRLEEHGVSDVFGIPGTHTLALHDAIARSGIRHVTPRHEQGAGYAADAYARRTGQAGVCVVTSGPGLTNVITAAATAYADSSPILVVAPGMPTDVDGRDTGFLHELKDGHGGMERLLARSVRVSTPSQAVEAIDDAFALFESGRPRPVHIEIPLDRMLVTETIANRMPASTRRPLIDAGAAQAAAELLRAANRCTIVLGGGSRDASDPARELAERLQAPVITTVNGKGVVDEKHALSLGASMRLRRCHEHLASCDVVLAVGTELGESDLWTKPPLPLRGALIRVDIDERQLGKNASAALTIHGDAREALTAIHDALTVTGKTSGDRGARAIEALRAAFRKEALSDSEGLLEIIAALEHAAPPGAVWTGDSAMICYFGMVHHLPLETPRRFLYPTGYATLGYALPAAIGAKVAAPGDPVIAVMGDGGAMFTLPELATAVELGEPMPIVIINNGGYGEIRREMLAASMTPIGVDLHVPDFAAVARAFGAYGHRTDDPGTLSALVAAAFGADRPTVIVLDVPE